MAAYASLLSLGHILDHLLQHPPRQMAVIDKAQIDSLLQNITFLQDFLEEFSLTWGDEIQGLEKKIARSAYAAEDIIEKRVVDQILKDSDAGSESGFTLFRRDLQKVMEKFGSMKKDVMKIKETDGMKRRRRGIFSCLDFMNHFKKETEGIKIMQRPRKAATTGPSIGGASNSKNTMVGFDDDLIQIMEKLTGNQSNLRIVSIVGMGGIGKTTLARNVYHHPCIVQHFHVHAWVTISQQYSVSEILLALLKDIRVLAECRKEEERKEINQPTDEELGEQLYKSLSGRKYLIVMDDMWSIECWNEIKMFFPDNNKGSRVMITTRLTTVADDFRSCAPHQLHFLDGNQSWALFCDKVFGKESCPPELEEVGKTIVRNCGALPLAIVVISGLLANNRTVEYWEYVANDTYAALNMGGDGLCFEILYLSYKHLPVHLKPCFLYMAIFPEDRKIRVSRLIKLWVAEGILKPIRCESLEKIAEDNLKDLIDRNLIQVHDYGSRNKIKTCTIHDLLRDLCLKEARKEKFLCVTMKDSLNKHKRIIDDEHPIFIYRSSHKEELESTFAKRLRLRKVLNMGYIFSDEEIVRLINSRYIDFRYQSFQDLLNAFESLSVLWNLQTVTIDGRWNLFETRIDLPAEIWEMPQLRHLKIKEDFYLPYPPSANSKNGRRDFFVLKNLQTLYNIRNLRFTDEVVHRIPNLKKLGIICHNRVLVLGFYACDYYELYNLASLHNLESLHLVCYENVLKNLFLPQSLKKLTLKICGVSWEDLTVVGSLPRLEALNLYNAEGREWKPVEGEFLELKSLRVYDTELVEWIADSSHFPRLEKLELVFLRRLKKIPQGIGEIPTLGSISLVGCSDSANSSARKIQEEQQELGNDDLQLKIK